jgi:S-DNA-T family DNA segregation ATPase FtsK/SpoIIIE
VKTRRVEDTRSPSRRTSDLIGLAAFFVGAACLLALTWPQGAIVPDQIADALRVLAGSGALVLPVILMFVGAMFLTGYERLTLSHSSYGSILAFLTFVIWRHVAMIHGALPTLNEIGTKRIMEAGGVIGGFFGTIMLLPLGPTWTYLFLVMMGCMSIVLLVERPFVEVLHLLFKKPAVAGVKAAKQGVAVVSGKSRAGSELPAGTGVKALAPIIEPEEAGAAKARGFFPFRRTPEEVTADLDRPDPHPVMDPLAGDPRKVIGLGGRRKKTDSLDQTAFPMLETETGGDDTFKLPPLTLLNESPPPPKKSQQELVDKIKILEQTLEHFNIQANVVEVAHGPTVTRYEIQLAPGIKVSKIVSLADNLAMSLAAIDVRVEAPIPGKAAIGVEVPNANPSIVCLRESIDAPEFWNSPSKLTFALGKDVAGKHKYADLAKMPHLLVAGSTNSGKSVCLNGLIASILYRATPAEVKFIMIDPKRVELSLWDGIPHLMHPVVKDVKQTPGIFRAALKEMERRYDMFARLQTRNIDGYNQRVPADEKLPYVVLIVDELADLMMQAGAEIETSICRLAQLARATGIHLVIATQRPSVDVITGLIKANISSRIAFAVSSQVDSRTILDMNGAERLIGRGDMLFMPIDASKPFRIQGCYMSETETNSLVKYLKEQDTPEYSIVVDTPGYDGESGGGGGFEGGGDDDDLFEACVRLVVTNGQASTSMLQRRFKVGYTRAARIVDLMYDRGIVGPPDGARPREILMSRDQVDQMFRTGRYGVPEELLE